ncbi:uncharacterized protein METZ01_LOCUS472933, partial [marine metagenome]
MRKWGYFVTAKNRLLLVFIWGWPLLVATSTGVMSFPSVFPTG